MEQTGRRFVRIPLLVFITVGLLISLGGVSLAEDSDRLRAGDSDAGTQLSQVQEGPLPEIEIDADDIEMEADVDADGSATLRVIYTIRLEADADIEAFEDLRSEIDSDPSSYLGPFTERMNRTVATAESATGREMAASEFDVSTARDSQLQTELGRVTFQFEWDQFASVDEDGTIRAGDAIDSLFLDDGERLEFRWPEGYGVQSSDPSPERVDDRLAVWRGPIEFEAGQPRLVLASDATTTTSTDAGGGPDSPDGGTDDGEQPDDSDTGSGSGFPTGAVLGLVGVLLVASAAVALFVRRESDTESQTAAEQEAATPPEELLSNEERVLQLLRQNGGRMKQKQVAEQLDWTAAKTSQVVGDLREADDVEAFRLGRENVLTLPDVDIEGGTTDGSESGDGETTDE